MGHTGAAQGRRYCEDRAGLPRRLLLGSGGSHGEGEETPASLGAVALVWVFAAAQV